VLTDELFVAEKCPRRCLWHKGSPLRKAQ
jgi:hypothetical protein